MNIKRKIKPGEIPGYYNIKERKQGGILDEIKKSAAKNGTKIQARDAAR